jgi:hypothetical protein
LQKVAGQLGAPEQLVAHRFVTSLDAPECLCDLGLCLEPAPQLSASATSTTPVGASTSERSNDAGWIRPFGA